MALSRRRLLRLAASAAAAAALPACGGARRIGGRIVGPADARGHQVWSGDPGTPPAARDAAQVVVVGGGVAGLAAAWRLDRAGCKEFRLLELEDVAGGTSVAGADGAGSFPWGARRLALPLDASSRALREFFAEIGAVDASQGGAPQPRSVVRPPLVRRWAGDSWEAGLDPRHGASAAEAADFDRFDAWVAELAARTDAQGRPWFAVPVAASARDPEAVGWDALSATQLLEARSGTTPALAAWMDFVCRDAFGTPAAGTSAWAALHAFATGFALPVTARRGAVAWHGGNGEALGRLARALGERLRTGAVVLSVDGRGSRVRVLWRDTRAGALHETTADRVVCALPRFVARRVVEGLEDQGPGFPTTTWIVSRVVFDAMPPSVGAPPTWISVADEREAVTVVASPDGGRAAPVGWTCYLPLGASDAARAEALLRPWDHWRDRALADLSRGHEQVHALAQSVDVMRWGHGSTAPVPGAVWGGDRVAARRARGRVHFASADLAGMPRFEEAAWHGARAAEEVLAALGIPFEPWV